VCRWASPTQGLAQPQTSALVGPDPSPVEGNSPWTSGSSCEQGRSETWLGTGSRTGVVTQLWKGQGWQSGEDSGEIACSRATGPGDIWAGLKTFFYCHRAILASSRWIQGILVKILQCIGHGTSLDYKE
jgi:hypothetical protein